MHKCIKVKEVKEGRNSTFIFDLAFRNIHRYVTVMKNASKAMDNVKRSSKF